MAGRPPESRVDFYLLALLAKSIRTLASALSVTMSETGPTVHHSPTSLE